MINIIFTGVVGLLTFVTARVIFQMIQDHLLRQHIRKMVHGDTTPIRLTLKKVRNDLPDFFDLFALSLSAGSNITAAWQEATAYLKTGDLKNYFIRLGDQLKFGRPVDECLAEVADQFRDPSIQSVFHLILHSLRRGAPLHTILTDQAQFLRLKNFAHLERRAQTAPIRMLFPIVLFLFPSIFIVLLGPIAFQVIETGFLF